MTESKVSNPVPLEFIERKIYLIRNNKVMLSPDLAALYEVEPRDSLNGAGAVALAAAINTSAQFKQHYFVSTI